MKNKAAVLLITLFTLLSCKNENSTTQIIKIEDRYQIELPKFLEKGEGLNESASLQYQNVAKEFYVIVIDEPKNELEKSLFENKLESAYSNNLKGYSEIISNNMKNTLSINTMPEIIDGTINGLKSRQIDFNANIGETSIYWKLGFAEGKDRYYQIMVWTLTEKKKEYEKQMQDIINSFRETDRSAK